MIKSLGRREGSDSDGGIRRIQNPTQDQFHIYPDLDSDLEGPLGDAKQGRGEFLGAEVGEVLEVDEDYIVSNARCF